MRVCANIIHQAEMFRLYDPAGHERSRLIQKFNQGFDCGFILVSAPAVVAENLHCWK
jgi:hypothetical protein